MFLLFPEIGTESQDAGACIMVCPKFWMQFIIYLLGTDEVSGESWQLITAIHNEGDSLTLCVQHLQGYDHSFFSF